MTHLIDQEIELENVEIGCSNCALSCNDDCTIGCSYDCDDSACQMNCDDCCRGWAG